MKISDLTIKPTTKWARFMYRLDWLRNQPVSGKLSKKINELLDNPNTKISLDNYVMQLGDLPLWIKNFPYAYGRFWDIHARLPIGLVKKRSDQQQTYHKQFGGKCPNQATIWRLRQVELAARDFLTSTKA